MRAVITARFLLVSSAKSGCTMTPQGPRSTDIHAQTRTRTQQTHTHTRALAHSRTTHAHLLFSPNSADGGSGIAGGGLLQAQTVANFYLAFEQGLAIVPVINKVDLPSAEPDRVALQLRQVSVLFLFPFFKFPPLFFWLLLPIVGVHFPAPLSNSLEKLRSGDAACSTLLEALGLPRR